MPAAMASNGEHGEAARCGRRIVAGLDEAGFGPVLGPLVIGATAWQTPDDCDGADLWRRLRGAVARTPGRRPPRLAINDSKKIYSPQRGLADLERGVLATFAARAAGEFRVPSSEVRGPKFDALPRFGRFLDRVSPGWSEQVAEHPWYAGCAELELPVASDAHDLATRANGLRVALRRGGVGYLGAALELVCESRYNRLTDAMGNKGRLLFCCSARVIQRLFDRFGSERLTVLCDKQGGRDSYRELLLGHWPDLRLTVLQESAERSGYRLADPAGPRAMELWFCQGADEKHLPAALASMYCKYTRELFMRLLNRFWQGQVGRELRATAGYYTDGRRFIGQVAPFARRLGVAEDRYVRKS